MVLVSNKKIQFDKVLQNFEKSNISKSISGANCIFTGKMKSINSDKEKVISMNLLSYEAMTGPYLEKLREYSIEKFHLENLLIVHRIGEVIPGDIIVIISSWAVNRSNAIEATSFVIEDLKHKAPFWKKEILDGSIEKWVEGNT
tara:strand:+ start:574 stop:1005 length:432 start_codon:yes stop_codon:yes gene_type:complete